MFVKREILLGARSVAWAIQPRSEVSRNVVGPVYKEVADQVYLSPHFIKLIEPKDRLDYITGKLAGFKYIMEMDYSRYDAH